MKTNKGITLIALVITIIILLILASITLNLLLGENGLLKRVIQGTEDYKIKQQEEISALDELEKEMDKFFEVVIEQVEDTTPGILEGEGTKENSYKVYSIEDLVAFSNQVNTGETFEGKYVTLGNNLDIQSTLSYVNANRTDFGDINQDGIVETLIKELTTKRGFNPIGSYTSIDDNKPFKGTFDGLDNTIVHLYEQKQNGDSYKGLFGYVQNAKIQNNKLVKANINSSTSVGGFIGYAKGNISLENCHYTGTITSSGYAGGLIGEVDVGNVSLNKCTNAGSLGGTTAPRGGLIGTTGKATIEQIAYCINTGTITNSVYAGGLVGEIGVVKNVNHCIHKGTIIESGIIGGMFGTVSFGSTIDLIEDCSNEGKLEGNQIGGIIGQADKIQVIRKCNNKQKIQGNDRVRRINWL